jgi:hypothetical protein
MGTLQTSFYNLKGVEKNEDCDHGHCVGLTINHGDGDSLVWLYVKSEAQADALKAILGAVTEVQLVDYV